MPHRAVPAITQPLAV